MAQEPSKLSRLQTQIADGTVFNFCDWSSLLIVDYPNPVVGLGFHQGEANYSNRVLLIGRIRIYAPMKVTTRF